MSGVRVFVSYRRDDSRHVAGRIADYVRWQRGVKAVFFDTRSLPPGAEFPARLEQALVAATHTLVVIGPMWSGSMPSRKALSPLFDEKDFIRREVSIALAGGGQVIPVLVDGAKLPEPCDVPEALQALVMRNAFSVHNDRAFDHELRPLLLHITGREPRGRDTLGSVAVKATAGAVAGLIAFLLFSAVVQFGFGLTVGTLFGTHDIELAVSRWELLRWAFVAVGAVSAPMIWRRWLLPSCRD